MSRSSRFITLSLFVLHVFALSMSVQAGESGASSNLFNYQKRIAEKGNVQAQFKLGSMYETGSGTTKDEAKAILWYQKAAENGQSAAQLRKTYLNIKQSGFSAKNTDWLQRVKASSEKGDADATYLLAQLYRQGIGVKKDLNKASELYDEVTVFDVPYVYQDLAILQAERDSSQNKKQSIKAAKKSVTQQPLKKNIVKTPVQTQANVEKAARYKQEKAAAIIATQQAQALKIKAEKKRKYDEVMLKIKREQQQIDDLQAVMSEGQTIGIDEEF